jgi:hypothetical protein
MSILTHGGQLVGYELSAIDFIDCIVVGHHWTVQLILDGLNVIIKFLF